MASKLCLLCSGHYHTGGRKHDERPVSRIPQQRDLPGGGAGRNGIRLQHHQKYPPPLLRIKIRDHLLWILRRLYVLLRHDAGGLRAAAGVQAGGRHHDPVHHFSEMGFSVYHQSAGAAGVRRQRPVFISL